MRIDYSLPTDCSKRLYIDANVQYGYRHIQAALLTLGIKLHTGVSLMSALESLAHVILGIAEMIPVIGHLLAFADKQIGHRDVQIIHLTPTNDPYAMGQEEGRLLKDEIQFTVGKVLVIFKKMMEQRGQDPLVEARKLKSHIPAEYIAEMKGMAETAGVSYEDLLIGNTIFDAMSLFGCSLYAASHDKQTGETQTKMATNYFPSQGRGGANVDNAFERFDAMQARPASAEVDALKQTLLAANYYDTVQSIIFDPLAGEIHLTTAGGHAANTKYKQLTADKLFPGRAVEQTAQKVHRLARNLDWPLSILGPLTKVIVRPGMEGRKTTAIVGWPGLIGAFSGMNEDLALAISVVPSKLQAGTCNQFIFRKILEEAGDIAGAVNVLNDLRPASPMNLCIAARDGIGVIELDPARAEQGAAVYNI